MATDSRCIMEVRMGIEVHMGIVDSLKRRIRRRLEEAGYFVFNTRAPGLYAHDGLFTFNNSHFRGDPRFKEHMRAASGRATE